MDKNMNPKNFYQELSNFYPKGHKKTMKIYDVNTERVLSRLIAASHLGYTIHHADGHRWIENPNEDSIADYNDHTLYCLEVPNGKVYGGIIEALDKIDEKVFGVFGKYLHEIAEECGLLVF